MKPHLFILTLAFTINTASQAQEDSIKKWKPIFKLGINYNSNLNYYGRTDSIKSSGLYPLAEIWLGEKFYINAAPVFINNTMQSLDYAGTVTTAGFLNMRKKWMTHIYLSKPFYEKQARLVQSSLQWQPGASLSFLSKAINLTIAGDVKFSDQTDLGASAGLDHLFKKTIGKKNVLVVDPSIYVFAGTQNLTSTFYKTSPGSILFPGSSQQFTSVEQKFNLLAWEVSVPVFFARGKLLVSITPSYVVPKNLTGREQGGNTFYLTSGIKYSF